jgi:hypothetical protein
MEIVINLEIIISSYITFEIKFGVLDLGIGEMPISGFLLQQQLGGQVSLAWQSIFWWFIAVILCSQGTGSALGFKHRATLVAHHVGLMEFRRRVGHHFWKRLYTWVPEGSFMWGMTWGNKYTISFSMGKRRGALPLKGPLGDSGNSNGSVSRTKKFHWRGVGWLRLPGFIVSHTSR